MRARAMDAKLEQEAAQLARHIDAMIGKYGSQNEVLETVVGKPGTIDTIRNYLQLGGFGDSIEVKALELMTFYVDGDNIGNREAICVKEKSDNQSCEGMYDIKDKVVLVMTHDSDAGNCSTQHTTFHGSQRRYNDRFKLSIEYYSHVKKHGRLFREYLVECDL